MSAEKSKRKLPNLRWQTGDSKTGTAKKKTPKVVKYRMGGLVIVVDPTGRKITIKQNEVYRERKVILPVSKKATKGLSLGSRWRM